ncbi:MAG: alpha amylase catalytic region [Pedosphaera sp.]|nr:alpha amylase catalytic region [Pedosphaera sp.]
MKAKRGSAKVLLFCWLGIMSSGMALRAAPEVQKVEPPNWWAGHSINPVQVLIRGKDLAGARVESPGVGLHAGRVRVNPAGTYLFVDVAIDSQTEPGQHPLTIITAAGTGTATFEISKPLPTEGHFQGFSPDDVIYLIMPDRFADGDPDNDDPTVSRGLFDRKKSRYYHGGDFQGIINHLPYLKKLGVTALWLNPWYDNVNHLNAREKYTSENRMAAHGEPITDYHGYGAVDFYGVEEHFGDLAKLQELVEAAHKAGLKIIQDAVPNHTGPYHPWVTNAPTATWYNGTLQQHLTNNWQTWSLTVPNAPADQRKQTLEGWFLDILPDLNQEDPDCARYLIQNSLWWAGVTGLDGIRLDTLPYVPRTFWRDWRAAVKAQYPDIAVVGEMFDGDTAKVSFFQGGCARFDGVDSGIESLFDFPLYYSIRKTFAVGKSMEELPRVLDQDNRYVDPARLVTFLGLHDVSRFMNEQGAYAAGLELAFTFLLTTRGIPMIYFGDEIGMPGGNDPDNRRDFNGGFPGDSRNAFEASGRTPKEAEIFNLVRQLLRLRAEWEPLRRGKLVSLAVSNKAYAYARSSTVGTAIVMLNSGIGTTTIECEVKSIGLGDGIVLHDQLGKGPELRVQAGKVKMILGARSGSIYLYGPPNEGTPKRAR